MPLPKRTASLAMMAGTEGRSPPIAFGRERATSFTSRPIPPRCASAFRAGDVTIVREGSGTGEGKAATAGQAHEIALKSAETDATKRALATFGNVFGLALYDREQAGVRQHSKAKAALTESVPKGPWVMRSTARAVKGSFAKPADFVRALREAMTEARDIERLFEIWEQNVATVRELNASREKLGLEPGFAPSLVAHLKSCAVALVKPSDDATEAHSRGCGGGHTQRAPAHQGTAQDR